MIIYIFCSTSHPITLFSFLCPSVPSPLRFLFFFSFQKIAPFTAQSLLPFFHPHLPYPLVLSVTIASSKMAFNKNTEKVRVARACHDAAQRKNRNAPVAHTPARRSRRRNRPVIPKGSDGSNLEGREGPVH